MAATRTIAAPRARGGAEDAGVSDDGREKQSRSASTRPAERNPLPRFPRTAVSNEEEFDRIISAANFVDMKFSVSAKVRTSSLTQKFYIVSLVRWRVSMEHPN